MERRMLGVFSLMSFLVQMRKAVFVPFLSLYLRNELETSYTQIGVILTLMVGINAVFQIAWGWYSDRIAKRKQFLILGEGIPAVVFLVLPHIHNITLLAAVLTAINIFWSMGAPAWKALIAEHSNPGERGEFMGRITTSGGVGAIIGPPIVANLISHYSYTYFFYFSALIMLLASFAAGLAKEPEGLQPSQQDFLSMEQVKTLYIEHRTFSLYTLLILLGLFGTRLIEGFISLFAASLGASVRQIGYLVMFRDGTETAFMIPMGRLTDRIGKVKMLRISLIISAFAVLLFAAAPVWWYLLLAVVVESVGWSGYYVSSFAVLSALTPKETRGTYMGLHSVIIGLSSTGSSAGGSIADRFGLRTLFYASFIFCMLVALYFITWLRKNQKTIDQSTN